MMEKMNKWLSAHKQLCVDNWNFWSVSYHHFLWPVFLAVIIQSLSLVIPVAAGLFFYEKFNYEKGQRRKRMRMMMTTNSKRTMQMPIKVHADAEKTEDLPKNHREGIGNG